MSKHTAGPWRHYTFADHDGPPSCDDIGVSGLVGNVWEPIALTVWADDRPETARDVAEANARMMATAPDLLAALQTFVDEYVAMVNSGDCGFWDPETEDKVKAARAAIAKATRRLDQVPLDPLP